MSAPPRCAPVPRRGARSLRALVLCVTASVSVVACSDPPPAGQLDGSFIIGDATAPPARDAAVRDALVAADQGPRSDGPELDATSPDAVVAADRSDADAADAGPPDPCTRTATLTLTATDAIARARTLDGQVVDVVGTATIAVTGCSRRACPSDNPCCNTCTADVVLDEVLVLRAGVCTARVGCTGDECNLVCSPPVLGFPQTFRGVMRTAPTPGLELMRVLP